ncbi:MAG: DUF302 domain-containing protein [Gammaproteobacteria bacterium]|nr:DUF302 domain-containing protein [Gammaproteobacteria bacterium]MDX2487902.1 DUF302 domain-containing protein [Gammaproteobacteria bacterium]
MTEAPFNNVNNGMAHVASNYSVADTVNKLDATAKSMGLTVFARIDFAADAKTVGLELKPKQLLIFGNPKGGTPLMISAPGLAIDLPMKILVWEDDEAQVWLSNNEADYLGKRHQLAQEQVAGLSNLTGSLVSKSGVAS